MANSEKFKLPLDKGSQLTQAFILKGSTQSTLSYTPLHDTLVHLSADVQITPPNGVAVSFLAGSEFVLLGEKEYIFSADIVLGLA